MITPKDKYLVQKIIKKNKVKKIHKVQKMCVSVFRTWINYCSSDFDDVF